MTGKDNPRGIYLPRRSSFKDPGTIYGAAFNGGPVPVWARADGLPVEDRPHGLIFTDHIGRCVRTLIDLGARVSGSAVNVHSFTREGIVQSGELHYYVHGFRYLDEISGRLKVPASMIISTNELSDAPIDDLFLGEPDDLAMALAELGNDFVSWCRETDFAVKPGRGAAGAMFLMDERFGWGPRARIPDHLNEIARDNLPGNYYRRWQTGKHAEVIEYDQRSAHHNAAMDISFPDSLSFGAMGRKPSDFIASVGTEAWSDLTKWSGLFRVAIEIDRKLLPDRTFPHFESLDIPGDGTRADIWVWSSELPYVLSEPGIKPLGILTSIASPNTNPGLNNYARWAASELERNAGNKKRLKWLKPFLLTAYGVAATRPKIRVAWSTHPSRNRTGDKSHAVVGGTVLEIYKHRKTRPDKQARYVNVFLRGEIEALVRARSILKARELDGDTRVEVISVYADAIFAKEIKDAEKWKLFADSVAGEPETNYARRERDEISTSAVRVTSRVSRSRRVTSPLPGPTPQIGSVTLVARPPDMRIDDGREIWQQVMNGSAPDLLEPIGGEFVAKKVLTNFEATSDTHWRADEDHRAPGVRRRKSSRGTLAPPGEPAIIPQDSGGNGPPASTLGSPNGHEPDHSEPRRRRPEARGRSG